MAGFSAPVSFFLICLGDSAGAHYLPHVIPMPAVIYTIIFSWMLFSKAFISFQAYLNKFFLFQYITLALYHFSDYIIILLYNNKDIYIYIYIYDIFSSKLFIFLYVLNFLMRIFCSPISSRVFHCGLMFLFNGPLLLGLLWYR